MSEQLKHATLPSVAPTCQLSSSHTTPDPSTLKQKPAAWWCLKLCVFHVCANKTCLWPGLSSGAAAYVHTSVALGAAWGAQRQPGMSSCALLRAWVLLLPFPWGSQHSGGSSPAGMGQSTFPPSCGINIWGSNHTKLCKCQADPGLG